MPSILKGRAKSCLVLAVFNAAMCLSSVGAQEQSSENWLEIWKQNGFAQISDDELVEQFASEAKIVSDSAVLTEFFADLTAPDFDILKPGASVNFGYEFNSQRLPVLALSDSSVTLKLNLFGLNRGENTTGINLLQVNGKTKFLEDVSLSLASKGETAAMLQVNLSSEATFNAGLNAQQWSEANNTLVDIAAGSSLILNGTSELSFETPGKVGTGIRFAKSSSVLKVNSSLTINAAKIFEGAGHIEVAPGDEGKIILNGSLKDFTGDYVQKGGFFETSGEFNKNSEGYVVGWLFTDVNITTTSSNLLKISASDWGLTSLQESTFSNGSTFNSITLTDASVSLDYLLRAQEVYKDSVLIAAGEVTVREGQLSEVTFDQHFGVLDNSNVILSHVTLNLKDESLLQNKEIKIGALKLDTQGDVQLENSNVVLYSAKGDVTENISKLIVENGSSLLIHGQAKYSHTRNYYEPTLLNSRVLTKEGALFTLSGQVAVKSGSDVENQGEMRIASNAAIRFMDDVSQSETGSLKIENDSTAQFYKDLNNAGTVLLDGTLLGSSVNNSGQIIIRGLMAVSSLNLAWGSRDLSGTALEVQEGGILKVQELTTKDSSFSLKGAKDGATSWAIIDKLSLNHAEISVEENSVLLYGVGSSGLSFQKESVEGLVKDFGLRDYAVLAVNSSLQLDSSSSIVVGMDTVRSNGANLVFGEGSALLFNPVAAEPVFTANGSASLALEQGSKLIVLDPFNLGYLTDSSVDVVQGFIGSEIVSANPNVLLGLEKDEKGWKFERIDIVEQNFLYPQIQNVLYNDFEDFNVNSANIGARFFARADNEKYMSPHLSHRLLAEGTQLSALTGAKTTAYLNANEALKGQMEGIQKKLLRSGETELYGGIIGSAVFSKHINSYLGEDKFKAFSEGVRAGAVYAFTDSLKGAFGASAVRTSSKSSGAVIEAKNKQWNYALNFALQKEFDNWFLGSHAGFYHANNRISGVMPSSMEMEDLKLKGKFNYMSLGAAAGVRLKEWGDMRFRPTVWHYPKHTENTQIGGGGAFSLKTKAQTFIELPLELNINQKISTVKGVDLSVHGGLEGSLRVGQTKDKAGLSIPGINASQKIVTGEINRWSASAEFGVQGQAKNFGVAAFVAAQTGDTRLAVTGGIKGVWRF